VKLPNYYELLQISPNADHETIHRVFQFLAARLHPDNAQTGDPEKFINLKQAYDVLSVPERRAEYDRAWERQANQQIPLSSSIDFMDDIEGELNRRMALLALLYTRRRNNPDAPHLSLFEVEKTIGIPRDYLEFTIWYVHKKGYITRADNSAFTLTADGVDFVESQRGRTPVLHKLLTSGSEFPGMDESGFGAGNGSRSVPYVVHPERRAGGDRRRHG
jgi:curved DNA-binding protein CbpA